MSQPGHKACMIWPSPLLTPQTLLGSQLCSLQNLVSPSLRVLQFAVLAPWNVLPKCWPDSFFLSFESPLLEEVPLRMPAPQTGPCLSCSAYFQSLNRPWHMVGPQIFVDWTGMDSIQENPYPAILPELNFFPSLGGVLKGGPKGCWGTPNPLGIRSL